MTFLERVKAKAEAEYGRNYGFADQDKAFAKGAIFGRSYTDAELEDVVEAIRSHDDPEVAAHYALQALGMMPV